MVNLMRFLAIVMICAVMNASCSWRGIIISKPEDINKYLAQIEVYNQEVEQLKASLDITAHGIMGNFIREQADIIVRSPKYLYWSLRSFFGPPSMVMTSNGEFVTMYDFSGQSHQRYQKLPIRDESSFEWLGFHFHPRSIINLFLAKIPLKDGHDIQLRMSEGILEI